ncbi:hypothetical protein CCM_08086 [Cordyceps militaris CM01]|uniref:Uncharacterized protein n=1 Tax=Cordyceps militaris (strain CM01) TaxID=983644 RepID=G3JNJ3_CORMM|nr:uncharacterized protein CCM_08086 [Cordyceps militaris CM01]EGX89833.1 hypothetical protein CCM_08086 [Cordyceps militaris CM01]
MPTTMSIAIMTVAMASDSADQRASQFHASFRCFEYLYTHDYSSSPSSALADIGIPDDDALMRHVRVYQTARFLGVPHLMQLATEKLAAVVDSELLDGRFLDVIRAVYHPAYAPPDDACLMRETVVELAVAYSDDMGPALQELLQERSLTFDVARFESDLLQFLLGGRQAP